VHNLRRNHRPDRGPHHPVEQRRNQRAVEHHGFVPTLQQQQRREHHTQTNTETTTAILPAIPHRAMTRPNRQPQDAWNGSQRVGQRTVRRHTPSFLDRRRRTPRPGFRELFSERGRNTNRAGERLVHAESGRELPGGYRSHGHGLRRIAYYRGGWVSRCGYWWPMSMEGFVLHEGCCADPFGCR
jgi:hypothetical protein